MKRVYSYFTDTDDEDERRKTLADGQVMSVPMTMMDHQTVQRRQFTDQELGSLEVGPQGRLRAAALTHRGSAVL